MSHEERNNIASLLAGLLVNIYIISRLANLYSDGSLNGADSIMVWARAILWAIPIGIATVIICIILFNILFAIAERDPKPSFVVDERDQAIKSYGMHFTMVIVSIAFFGGVVALAFGANTLHVLIAMFFGFSLGDLIGNFAKLIRYRYDV
ncbi:MAG: hypothetical protein V3U96_05010 [Paracoccaceae bacterium]